MRLRETFWFTVYLVTSLLAGVEVVHLSERQILRLLSWTYWPGPLITLAILVFGGATLVRSPSRWRIALAGGLFFSSMWIQWIPVVVPVSTALLSLTEMGVVLFASAIIFDAKTQSISKTGFWLIGAYLHASFLFNAHTKDFMWFFPLTGISKA